MKILVTGAAGFIGSHLCERLVHEGHTVVGLDAFTDYYDVRIKEINFQDVVKAGATFFKKNLALDDLSDAVRGCEAVFHCAAQPGISSDTPFDSYLRNNIIATERLLDAVEKDGSVRIFVNLATSSVYGLYANSDESSEPKPASSYGVTKLAAEQLVMARARTRGLPATSLRIFSVFGERERPEKLFHKLINAILEDTPFPLFENSREHVRSFSYIGDVIDGCVLVLNNYPKTIGELYNLGSEATNTTGEGIQIIEELLGKKAQYIMLPPRLGDQKDTAANIAKARATLGFSPRVGLREGLQREVEWYKTKIHGKLPH